MIKLLINFLYEQPVQKKKNNFYDINLNTKN